MEERKNTKQKRILLGILLVLALAGVCVAGWYLGKPLVEFISQPEQVRQWVESKGLWARIAFCGMVILQVCIAVIPGEPFEIAAGYAFGAFEGTVLCVLASTIGSILVFWLVRLFGMKLVRLFFSEEKIQSVKFLQTNSKREFLFLVIFMIPGTPKDLLCYFAGLTDMRFPVWLLICSLGRFPAIITSTIGGDALGTENYWGAVIVFAVAMVISAVGLLIYNRITKEKNNP